jgi:hypothetical protein
LIPDKRRSYQLEQHQQTRHMQHGSTALPLTRVEA